MLWFNRAWRQEERFSPPRYTRCKAHAQPAQNDVAEAEIDLRQYNSHFGIDWGQNRFILENFGRKRGRWLVVCWKKGLKRRGKFDRCLHIQAASIMTKGEWHDRTIDASRRPCSSMRMSRSVCCGTRRGTWAQPSFSRKVRLGGHTKRHTGRYWQTLATGINTVASPVLYSIAIHVLRPFES
jgi:hypothetical protein